MKKFCVLLMAMASAFSLLAEAPRNYYDNALGKNDEPLMSALCGIIRDHTQLSYSALWNAFKTTDTDAQGYIIDMYSNCMYRPDDHGGSSSAVGGGFNREHSFPKSWFDDNYPMYTDLFHLYPTDIKVNGQRSNFPFGVCANGTRLVNGKYYGKGKLGTSTYPGYNGTVFEPDDEYKGDFARTYFYMVTCYKNELRNWSGSPQLNYAANKYKAFSNWSISMLMEWTRLDPVSDKEIKRNDAVYAIQGNRNPFIDHPELAEFIWGDKQGQPWTGSADPVLPGFSSPKEGDAFYLGTTAVGTPLECTITVKGHGLSKGLTLTMRDNENFYVSKTSFTASEINSGYQLTVGFTADDEGYFDNTIIIASEEVSVSFSVMANAETEVDPPGPGPDPVLGDSIMEDWEGCTTGGYWTKQVQGHTWLWDFTDAGIWGDNIRHGELSCRLGKSSSSAIAMAEDVEGGTSAFAFWAASYGSDSDAKLQVEYSIDRGSSWSVLGDFTVT
ncbi:MAG: endonuclease, partial [Muribaculaceae bacterium]|nr:endonuclease [Muribaculaceae bacterium]